MGREHDLNDFSLALEDASSGSGRLILVGGEPGIGKTRLCAELSAMAETRRMGVLWGSCWEADGAPAFWPWIQVLRAYVRGRDPEALRSELAGGAADVARLLPELSMLSPPPPPASSDPDHERFRLFDAVTSFLRSAGDARPHLLVLDDLHWADTASLLLLRFLAGELRQSRLLVVGTYRDVELRRAPGRTELLAELTRVDQHLVLGGLPETDVARLISSLTGVEPGPELVAELHRETRGNPFFVREIVGVLGIRGPLESGLGRIPGRRIPAGVRGLIQHRLGSLSPECRALLAAAAVAGHEFRLEIVEAATGAARERQLEWLQEAIDARLIEEAPQAPGRWRFFHALVREVVYEGLAVAERLRLHRRVGEAIEATFADESSRLAELAHHFLQAAVEGTAAKAVRYAAAAGEHALEQFAYEQAADHFGRALQALDCQGTADPSRRCAVLVSLGKAQMAASRVPEARATMEAAAVLARAIGSAELMARAALGVAMGFTAGVVDELEVRLLEQALDAVGAGDSQWRARVLARLARALLFTPEFERRLALSEDAVAVARRLGDAPTLAAVLFDRHVAIWGGANAEERLGIASEVVQLADRCGDPALALQGRALRLGNLLELGDVRTLDGDIEVYERLTRALRQPQYLWHVPLLRATQSALGGRFPEAESLAGEGLEAGTKALHQSVGIFYGTVLAMIRTCQGRFAELEGLLRENAVRYPSIPAWRAALSYALVEAGRDVEARIELARLAAHDFADLPRDFTWLANAAFLALTCAGLPDAPRAATLHALLLPYARYHVRVTRIGIGSMGAVAHYLGLCAVGRARWDDAVRHFDAAVEANGRIGAVAFLANSHDQRGKALRARGHPGDRERAREDASLARRMADTLAIRLQLQNRDRGLPAEQPPADAEVRRAVLRREGEYWTVSYRTPPFRLRHTIGLGYIAELVAEPGREHHVLGLTAIATGGQGEPGIGSGSAGPHLDARAKAAYRQRLEELQEELAEATSWADTERAARSRAEMDALAEQLAEAVGLGGRDRVAASDAERARSSVTKAIKAAVQRIAEHDPVLADHLRRSLRTGTFCSYIADPSLPISWQL